jgi:hypothetical protein
MSVPHSFGFLLILWATFAVRLVNVCLVYLYPYDAMDFTCSAIRTSYGSENKGAVSMVKQVYRPSKVTLKFC